MNIQQTIDQFQSIIWISLALFGEFPTYLTGTETTLKHIFKNKQFKAILYYDESVPITFISNLRDMYAESDLELIDMTDKRYPPNECRASWRFLAFSDPTKNNVVSLDIDGNEIERFEKNYMNFFKQAREKWWWGMSLAGWNHINNGNTQISAVDACYLMKCGCFVDGLDSLLLQYCRRISSNMRCAHDVTRVGYGTDEAFLLDEMIPLWRSFRNQCKFTIFRWWRASSSDILFSDIEVSVGRTFKRQHSIAKYLDNIKWKWISSQAAELMLHELDRDVVVKNRRSKRLKLK